MAKKAFVIGANSTKLDYAESDAEKISQALSNLGYEFAGLTSTTEDNYQVVQGFRKFAATCKQYDTLIFYFAGHGVSHNNTLYLVLNSSKFNDIPSSAIPITDITTTLNNATAQNRLIILDCCEASNENLVISNAENYQVLRATEKWQRASEFEELKAGFLSFHLHKLLTEPVARHLLNENYGLTFNTLLQELRKQVQQHNKKHPDKIVPNFVREGKDNNDYEIATLTPQYAGLLAITPQFIEQERHKNLLNPHLYSCEQFYGANPQAQWWGVTQGLVAKRQIYQKVKAHIYTTLQKHPHKPIIGVLLGSGGMGKSTLLLQLAFDLAKENYSVFWLNDWENFAEQRIGETLGGESPTALICLDNWHRFDESEKKAMKKWWQQKTELHGKVKWLISDRTQARDELSEFIYGGSEFDLDKLSLQEKQQDNLLLLAKVAQQLEQWQAAINLLTQNNIAQAKPFHILFVLFRWAGESQQLDFQDFEGVFRSLIKDDIETLRNDEQFKGFADALIDFAALFVRFNVRLTQATFLRLADFYRHEKEYLFSCYQTTRVEEEVWGVLRYYLSEFGVTRKAKGSEGIFLKFVKDDLAEAIDNNFGRKFDQRKSVVCRFIINDINNFSASEMLYAATIHNVFDTKTILVFIKKLLDNKNSVDTYLRPIFDSTFTIDISNEIREELLGRFIAINSDPGIIHSYLNFLGQTEIGQQKAIELLDKTQNKSIILKCFKILKKTEASHQKAIEFIDKIQDEKIIYQCLNLLYKTEIAQQKALELLNTPRNQKITCKCFDILGETEKSIKKASELLIQKNQSAQVICKCFDILGQTTETQNKARDLLKQANQHKNIICKCLDILGKTEETQNKARELLAQENQATEIICKCFDILGKNELTKKYARQFISDYSNNESVLAWCINILEEEAKSFALKQLENWKSLKPQLRLLQNCLYVCRNESFVENIVKTIIEQKNLSTNRYISVLKIPFSHMLIWQQETSSVLINWQKYERRLVGASLTGIQNDLSKAKQTCEEILPDWEREISYQQEKGYRVYHFHIFKALSYPSAEDPLYRSLVDTTAKAMLEKEKQQPGFLGEMLYEAAYNIVHHQQYPAWIPEEENV